MERDLTSGIRRRAPSRIRRWFDDSHLGYTMISGLERFLGTFSPPFVILIGLLLMLLIGVLDAVTGPFAVAVFYLVPIGLVTYSRGRWVGTLMAATAALAWTGVELVQEVTSIDSSVTYWNCLTRFYVYEAIALLIAPMRDVVTLEREVASREAEAADKLRALNELRSAIEAEEGGQLARLEAMVEFRRAMTQAEIAHGSA
jgi:K+-sensing histidine kinase KdpD